jgi:hypothetical protein
MIAPGTAQTIEARLVRYVRKGAKEELDANLMDIQAQLDATIDPPTLHCLFACFDDSRALFEFAGFVDEPEQAELTVDLSRWPTLLLRVLESQHDAEVRRLEDAAAGNFMLPIRDVPALGALIDSIREKLGLPPRGRDQSRDQWALRRLARMRKRRRRGNG